MNDTQRIQMLEEELKILKNEVKTVLLDLREQYMNVQNPFNSTMNQYAAEAGAYLEPRQQQQREVTKKKKGAVGKPADNLKEADDRGDAEDVDQEEIIVEQTQLENDEQPGRNNDIGLQGFKDHPSLTAQNMEMEAEPGFSAEPSNGDISGFMPNVQLPGEMPGQVPEQDYFSKSFKEQSKVMLNKRNDWMPANGNAKFDLVVIAGLTQWVDQATTKLGKERAEALVEMSHTMGRIPENLKDVLIKMARLSKIESNDHAVDASDYLALLAHLENLLGNSEIQDNALLSILSMMKESNSG